MRSGFGKIGTLWPDHFEVDQEPAIVDVLKEIANLCESRGMLLEQSPVADSQSNGLLWAESGQLRRWQECFFLILRVESGRL